MAEQVSPIGYLANPNEPRQFVVQAYWCGKDEKLILYFGRSDSIEKWDSTSITKDIRGSVVTLPGAEGIWKGQIPHWIRRRVIKGYSLDHPPADGRTELPPLWPESVIKAWNDWPSSVRNELRREGWSLRKCRKIVKTDAWKAWRRERTTEALGPIRDLLPVDLSKQAPLGGSEEWPGVFLTVDKGEYIPGVRDFATYEYHLSKSEFFDGRIVIDMPIEEVEKDYILKPYPNENSCRLSEPGKYDKFRRGSRKSNGRIYHIIYGRISGTSKWEEQAYRYPVSGWTEAEARKHCKDHDGIKFEPAVGKEARQ